METPRKHVVIIGGGFGGLTVAQNLGNQPVDVTLVDRTNYHLFQPLLYQVAMAGLSPADIAVPIRAAVHRQKNVRVILAEATGIDVEARRVDLKGQPSLHYDMLVVAAGARTHYFGHPEWSKWALGLKDLDEAVEIRRRILLAFEAAEREPDPEKRKELLRFVVIGGGPTGVELAGTLAEIGRFVLSRDYRRIAPGDTEVTLLEAGPRVLSPYATDLSAKAQRQLEDLGVRVRTGTMVERVDDEGVHVRVGESNETLPAAVVLWGAGVHARPLVQSLGVELDRGGRVIVNRDCSIPGHPEVFAIGDISHHPGEDGRPLPGLAPVAMQQARYVAKAIGADLRGRERGIFRYRDKGMMSTIGRSRAVAQIGKLKFSGFLAWLSWTFVHLLFLVGFRNRAVVFFHWTYNYLTYRRGARLITGRRIRPGVPDRIIEPSEVERAAEAAFASRPRAAERPPLH